MLQLRAFGIIIDLVWTLPTTLHPSCDIMSTLHDAIWTGSIDRGLPAVAAKSVDEINRLPYLLRFLKINEDDDTALERIQDRAVLYPTSENVQVITGYLAPHVCRKRNRVQDGTKPSLQEEASSADAMEVDRVGEGEDEKVDDLEGYVVNVWNDLHQLVELAGSTSEEIALSVPHSTFAQPVSSSLVGGGNDLAVALVSLMYHCDISHRALAVRIHCQRKLPKNAYGVVLTSFRYWLGCTLSGKFLAIA